MLNNHSFYQIKLFIMNPLQNFMSNIFMKGSFCLKLRLVRFVHIVLGLLIAMNLIYLHLVRSAYQLKTIEVFINKFLIRQTILH
jgi:hypothetical protein